MSRKMKVASIDNFNSHSSFSLFYFICRTASKFCCHISKVINLTWTLRGAEHLSKDQTCVIVANHQSSLDVLGKLLNDLIDE